MLRAISTCSGVSDLGRPSFAPRFCAAMIPARVRSRSTSRSNWAMAAKTWNVSLPDGVVVSAKQS